MSDDEDRLRAALETDLSGIVPRPGGEGRLYRGMERTRTRRSWSAVGVPIAVAVAIVVLVLAVPLVFRSPGSGVSPAGQPCPTGSMVLGEEGVPADTVPFTEIPDAPEALSASAGCEEP
ncbi:hypothetical protein [Kineosporia succinea]|uniref:DUF3040 family protein n=1 Tax=Kineosporia succinea TaxID=84632 RepID=A0ABT9P9E3_9ACTN|nr:hypothetical protein [Kineosporia succinea]MDP9829316.1 hypothetical protein [Kineosporia succinea]